MDDDIRKVITGLRCLGGDFKWKPCSTCPYHGKGLEPCRTAICADAERLIRLSVNNQKDTSAEEA